MATSPFRRDWVLPSGLVPRFRQLLCRPSLYRVCAAAGRAAERLQRLREPVDAHADLSLVDQARRSCPAVPCPPHMPPNLPVAKRTIWFRILQLAFVLAELIEVSCRPEPCNHTLRPAPSTKAHVSASARALQEDAHADELAQSGVVQLLLVRLLTSERTAGAGWRTRPSQKRHAQPWHAHSPRSSSWHAGPRSKRAEPRANTVPAAWGEPAR